MCYLEAEDDGPDEAQRQAVVPVHDVVRAHVLQVDSLLLQELQRFVHVLQTVDPHSAFGWLGLQRGRGQRQGEGPEAEGEESRCLQYWSHC